MDVLHRPHRPPPPPPPCKPGSERRRRRRRGRGRRWRWRRPLGSGLVEGCAGLIWSQWQ